MFSEGPWGRNAANGFGRAYQRPFSLQGSYSRFLIKWGPLSVAHLILTTALCSILGWRHYSHLLNRSSQMLNDLDKVTKSIEQTPWTHPLTFQSGALPAVTLGVKQEWHVISWEMPLWVIAILSFCVELRQSLSDQREGLCGPNWSEGIH